MQIFNDHFLIRPVFSAGNKAVSDAVLEKEYVALIRNQSML